MNIPTIIPTAAALTLAQHRAAARHAKAEKERRARRDKDLFPKPPVLRIDNEVTDAPIGIRDEEILDVSDLAIAGMDMIAGVTVSMLRRCGSSSLRSASAISSSRCVDPRARSPGATGSPNPNDGATAACRLFAEQK